MHVKLVQDSREAHWENIGNWLEKALVLQN